MVREAVEKICREFSGQCCIHKPLGAEAQVSEVSSSTLPGAPSSAPACSSCRGQTAGGGYQCRWDGWSEASLGEWTQFTLLTVCVAVVDVCTASARPAPCVSRVASHTIRATTWWELEHLSLSPSADLQLRIRAGERSSLPLCLGFYLFFSLKTTAVNMGFISVLGSIDEETGASARQRNSAWRRRSGSWRRRWRRSGSSWGWRGGVCSGAVRETETPPLCCCNREPRRLTALSECYCTLHKVWL